MNLKKNLKNTIGGLALSIGLVSPLGLYAKSLSDRPPQTSVKTALFQGIDYERQYRRVPRPHVIHLLTLDLKTPGLKVFVTPSEIEPEYGTDTHALTTSEALQKFRLQIAVNAGFCHPFSEQTPWGYYPQSGDRTDVLGTYISGGDRYSFHPVKWPKLCFKADQSAMIVGDKTCPEDTLNAVSGNLLLNPVPRNHPEGQRLFKIPVDKPYPRTIAALNQAGTQLWIIVIDGKQPGYSEGLTSAESEHLLAELGVHQGVNLDGGGSVTLAQEKNKTAQLLNAPIHGKWPMNERPIATHLGFYAPPLPFKAN